MNTFADSFDQNSNFQPSTFAGGLYDFDTGLVRSGARDYDSRIGRWTTRDPAGFKGGMNGYAYVNGNPMTLIDPSGHFGIGGAGFGLIAGGAGAYVTSDGDLAATALGAVIGAGIGTFSPAASLEAGVIAKTALLALGANVGGQAVGNIIRTGDTSAYAAFSKINVPSICVAPFAAAVGAGTAVVGTAMGISEGITGTAFGIGGGYIDGLLSDTGNINLSQACGLKPSH